MKICLLNRYFDFRGTGVTRIATEVTKELHKQGHEVIQVPADGKSLYSYAYKTAIELPVKLPRVNVDVYHALATLESIGLPPHKSIATYLDLFTTTNPDRAGAGMGYNKWKLEIGKRYFAIGSLMAANCRYLVCISEKTKQDVIQYIMPDIDKLRVIRLGIPDSLKPLNIKHSRFTIGTLGQLDKRKRIDLLITAFHKCKLDADLLIAGQGTDRSMLESIANSDKRIKFLGLVPENELCQFYNSLDVFVFPTGIEGYGLPVVEAAACNKPIVVLNDSILPQEVRDHCYSVESLDELFSSMNNLETVIKDTDYRDNLKFARLHSWNKCVKEYIKLYEDIARNN